MMRLLDGPARGSFAAQRAPLYLRGVVHRTTGKTDVLDQPVDEPTADEAVYLYRRTTEVSWVHLNMGGLRRGTGMYVMADYEHLADIDGETLRTRAALREWVAAQPD